jgi:DnaJ like chaperone protein
MGQLFNRLKDFIKVSAADVNGDLGRAQRIIDAEDDELSRIIAELRRDSPSGNASSQQSTHRSSQQHRAGQRPAVPAEVITAARVLGVTYDAPADVVKRAYRKRITAVHPDRMAGRTVEEQHRAEEEAKAVNAAYDTMQRYLGFV